MMLLLVQRCQATGLSLITVIISCSHKTVQNDEQWQSAVACKSTRKACLSQFQGPKGAFGLPPAVKGF